MIQPRNDWVALESFADECRNTRLNLSPLIIVPDRAKEPSMLSKVLAIGPKVCEVQVGDVVLSPRYGGAEAKTATLTRYFLMREEELLARVEVN